MNYDKELCENFILVDMNDVDISTVDNPVIGTQALATCVGVLLYNEHKKSSIVAHVSANVEDMIYKIKRYIYFYDYDKENIKYLIIPGYYKSGYLVDEYLEEFCQSYSNFEKFNQSDIPTFAIERLEDSTSCQFAFDSRTGKFVTNKVLFGIDLINFMNSKSK